MSALKSTASVSRLTSIAGPAPQAAETPDRALRLQRRVEREHAARHEAERLLESKSLELFAANQRLTQLNADLELRVDARTRQAEEARQAAVKLGTTDYLTGIANRFQFSRRLEQSLARSEAEGSATGLLLIDIDGFKLVNDTYGHSHGDRLLVGIADRLHAITRQNELVARIGGDEFAIIIDGADEASILQAAQRFRSVFESPHHLHGATIASRGSMGLAVSPDHCTTYLDLQRFADLALYQSKSQGLGQVVAFKREFLDAYEFRQRMEAELRVAVDSGAISLHYQPIVGLRHGCVDAVEALARWTDSNGNEISPGYFIGLAEQCGIIPGFGRKLLARALLETREWIASERISKISFNVSPLEFLDEGFAQSILSCLETAQVDGRHLVLEITEGAVLQNIERAADVMHHLRSFGVTFALDDFGCGYSNLSSLSRLPISVLKIDRSLLMDAENNSAVRTILRSVISLCRSLGIRSVCEGAETPAQLTFLRQIKCDAVQGFISGRPGSALDVGKMLTGSAHQRAAAHRQPVPAGH